MLAGIFACSGCAMGTSGGPGTETRQQPIVGQADDTFRLSTPQTVIRQGETRSVSFTIKRAINFNEDVTLQLGDLPKGLSVDDASPRIKHGDSEAHFALTAADDASLGDFSLKVTGHPTKGSDATNEYDITVNRK